MRFRSTRKGDTDLLIIRQPLLQLRAPTPPRFIGHSTWISRIGSRPCKRFFKVVLIDAQLFSDHLRQQGCKLGRRCPGADAQMLSAIALDKLSVSPPSAGPDGILPE